MTPLPIDAGTPEPGIIPASSHASLAKVLVANRGEVAVRIIRTLDRMGISSVAVCSEADLGSLHVRAATESVLLGPPPPSESYLRADAVLDAALATGADAVHPGYGFLSENADFARAVEDAGLVFLGPTPQQIHLFGDKGRARDAARDASVPLLAGSGLLADGFAAVAAAEAIGYPVMLKSSAGGGGIGMQVCHTADELSAAFDQVQRTATAAFGSGAVFVERFVDHARHVEVQVVGDGHGLVVVLGDRDCSAQRRNQKVLEESPAPNLPAGLRHSLHRAAGRLMASVSYRSAGTVEFLIDVERGEASFLEVNTRLQVEHPVTEETHGIDLVEWMVRLGAGDPSVLADPVPAAAGHAVEARVYAEDPARGYRPSSGRLTEVVLPTTARCDTWVERGTEVSPFYDPLLAKVVAHGPDRAAALAALSTALDEMRIDGIETNLGMLRALVAEPAVVEGRVLTSTLTGTATSPGVEHRPATMEVREAGNLTTVQDHPGRLGYWSVGVPPSGPMDSLSFRLGNRIVGNPDGATGLELTVRGPTLCFGVDTVVALAGAAMEATLDGAAVGWWRPIEVPAGAELRVGRLTGPGCRAYLLVRGGFDVPTYLGSASTFTLGGFGGHAGRALRVGDVLHLCGESGAVGPPAIPEPGAVPDIGAHWEVGVLPGPHAAPDYFTPADIDQLYAAPWKVHFNSARTGVRLIGPRPTWARPDGGDAGLHPSNIHDVPYAVGTVDFTGDMPIILGPDGPSLGGFVCPATTARAELWKLGQLSPGDTVRFTRWTVDDAATAWAAQEQAIATLAPAIPTGRCSRPKLPPSSQARVSQAHVSQAEPPGAVAGAGRLDHGDRAAAGERRPAAPSLPEGVLWRTDEAADRPQATYRQDGDGALIVEYGPDVLDLDLRFRVHALATWLEASAVPGILDVTPGIRSLQLHVDPTAMPTSRALDLLVAAEAELPPVEQMVVPSRVVHLPLSWDDPATVEATQRYMQVVRSDAPWCPHNLEFIRRVNGLGSIDDVYRIVMDASYLVLGLGDVYLGAPVATPLDPRHRLVTTKYNPARTWTPENAVGIGGAYLCIYGMEGPGGYQFVGRTVPVWNTWRTTRHFEPGAPWLLRTFDQLRFFPVSADELLDLRRDLLVDRASLRVEETTFSLAEYHRFLADNAAGIAAFRSVQQAAFAAERVAWEASGELERAEALASAPDAVGHVEVDALDLPPGSEAVCAPVGASVWQVPAAVGDKVDTDDALVVLEAMKMELRVGSPAAGTVLQVLVVPGEVVSAGQPLVVLSRSPHAQFAPAAHQFR